MLLMEGDDLSPPSLDTKLIRVEAGLKLARSWRGQTERSDGHRLDVGKRWDGNAGTLKGLDQVDDTLHAARIRSCS